MIPISKRRQKVNIMGLPFHGLVEDGQFTKPDTSVVTVPNASPTNHLLNMGHQMPDRFGNQHDIDNGYEWRDKLLLSGITSLPAAEIVYVDDNDIPWIIEVEYVFIDLKQYQLLCRVKRKFGLFEETPPTDLNFQFFDSGALDYTALTADLGLFSLGGIVLNQDEGGQNTAVALKGNFRDDGVDPMLSWMNNERVVVEVRVLGITGVVNELTGSGLAATYNVQIPIQDCCGGVDTSLPPPGAYTSFGHREHRWSINTPINVRSSCCEYYNAPFGGISQSTDGGLAPGNLDSVQFETAPGGLRHPFLTNVDRTQQKTQYAVLRAYYVGNDLKVVRAKCQEYVEEEGVELSYTYTREFRYTRDDISTRDNDCRYTTYNSLQTDSWSQHLLYTIEERKGYEAEIQVNGQVLDSVSAVRSVRYTSTIDSDVIVPDSIGGATDQLQTGGFQIYPDFDVTDDFAVQGLVDIPVGVESDLKLTVTLSGVVNEVADSPFFRSFEYPRFRSIGQSNEIGNVLVGFDLIDFAGWDFEPGYRYQSLIGPDVGSIVTGETGVYAVYDPFNLSIHNDISKQLCVI